MNEQDNVFQQWAAIRMNEPKYSTLEALARMPAETVEERALREAGCAG